MSVLQEMKQYNVTESEGTIQVCWNLSPPNVTFKRSVEFQINTLPGTASELDYTSLLNVTITPSNISALCVTVEIVLDSVIEDSEVFAVVLSSRDTAVEISSNTSTIQVSQLCS